ncbi:MAG: hypothetical protein M3Z21_06250 [Pseudomonadota bacterium]|nr:hypothetical protein [Pseudomonadota bacterium]
MGKEPNEDLVDAAERQLPAFLRLRGRRNGSLGWVILSVIGVGLIAFGIAGLVLPLAPGVIPILIGLILLGLVNNTVRSWINRSEAHLPRKYRLWLRRRLRKNHHSTHRT